MCLLFSHYALTSEALREEDLIVCFDGVQRARESCSVCASHTDPGLCSGCRRQAQSCTAPLVTIGGAPMGGGYSGLP